MNTKRDKGPDNPWVRKTDPADEEGAAPEQELPPSPWSLEVPPRPAGDAAGAGTAGTAAAGTAGGAGAAGAGGPGQAGAAGPGQVGPGQAGAADGRPAPAGGESAGSGPWAGSGGASGATSTSSAWGDKVGPPSLRRPEPVKKKPSVPPLLLPVAAGIAVVLLIAVALVVLTGGDDAATPQPSPSVTVTTPPAPTYTPPPNAIAVEHGVSVVPASGWSVLATEKQGKQLVTYAPNGQARAFFWVRQKVDVAAQTYLLGIVEGETAGEIAQLGNVRNLACPRDVLVECVAISYTSTAKAGKVKGYVEVYKRKDGVLTALDFRSRADYAAKAESDAAPMKQSVIDSL
ncbi:hypothetical protein Kfla_3110 [Kribbella flavida DSM 17836]|uniref:Uncharacterized protein n=1 Tax=Kribbella flavida (strain DSM 17836 / JCM 10339 / NBRC 14399) TaxID=479435 RepID=D2Q349_KRIFD|nr:hypothetical protein [Kribbella flavida]ADB32174.1 hypothetical protein Kfla_3110 [Kribbella flavida DSM 17836]